MEERVNKEELVGHLHGVIVESEASLFSVEQCMNGARELIREDLEGERSYPLLDRLLCELEPNSTTPLSVVGEGLDDIKQIMHVFERVWLDKPKGSVGEFTEALAECLRDSLNEHVRDDDWERRDAFIEQAVAEYERLSKDLQGEFYGSTSLSSLRRANRELAGVFEAIFVGGVSGYGAQAG